MMKELLDISGKLDSASVDVYRAVAEATEQQSIDYLVVGANARDLVLHHGYGLRIQRATLDLDFAIEVGEWGAYQALKEILIAGGFEETQQKQGLKSPDGLFVDIIPFGDLADDKGNIAWPPDHSHEMNVLGFAEAHSNADMVRLHDVPALDVPIVSPVGLVLLKLIAWRDRARDKRARDALDIRHVLENYVNFPPDVAGIWDSTALLELLEQFNEDIVLVSSSMLGTKVNEMANEQSRTYILDYLGSELKDELVLDMDSVSSASPSESARLLNAFIAGFAER